MSGELGGVAQGSGQGGKAAPLRGKSSTLGASCPLVCPLLTLNSFPPPPLFDRKTHAEHAAENDAEDAKGIPQKLTL